MKARQINAYIVNSLTVLVEWLPEGGDLLDATSIAEDL